jgi:pre-mRNA-splicing factor ATP-dependent RNA helicase DHX15/PRP43
MPIDQQQRIFDRSLGVRKIIVSTNIAETSVTIDGIVYVIDSGFSKQKLYHPKYKFDSLKIAPISQASALQRAGRAGRTCPGKCYRLYTEKSFTSELPPVTEPEIKRNELSNMILGLNTLGITQLTQFDFIEAPPTETIFRGLEILQQINAITSPDGQLTKVGEALSRFPLEPRMGKVLLVGRDLGVGEECLNVVSVLAAGNWKVRPSDCSDKADQAHRQFSIDPSCDLAAINSVLKSFITAPNQKQFCLENFVNFKVLSMSLNIKTQLKQMLLTSNFEGEVQSEFASLTVGQRLKIAFLAGYFQHVAHLQPNGTYAILFNEPNCVLVHPASVVKTKPEFLMYIEYILTVKDYIRTVSEINIDWLLDLYPEMFRSTSLALMTDHSRKRVQSVMAPKAGHNPNGS